MYNHSGKLSGTKHVRENKLEVGSRVLVEKVSVRSHKIWQEEPSRILEKPLHVQL